MTSAENTQANDSQTESSETIGREDIESTLRSVVGEATEEAKTRAQKLIPAATALGFALLAIAYFAGRRVGAKRSTVVEIRRI